MMISLSLYKKIVFRTTFPGKSLAAWCRQLSLRESVFESPRRVLSVGVVADQELGAGEDCDCILSDYFSPLKFVKWILIRTNSV